MFFEQLLPRTSGGDGVPAGASEFLGDLDTVCKKKCWNSQSESQEGGVSVEGLRSVTRTNHQAGVPGVSEQQEIIIGHGSHEQFYIMINRKDSLIAQTSSSGGAGNGFLGLALCIPLFSSY